MNKINSTRPVLVNGFRFNPGAYLFFWIWPLIIFLISFLDLSSKRSRTVILMFSFIFGYSVFYYSGDLLAYKESFYAVSKYDWRDYIFLTTHFLDPDRLKNYDANTVTTQPDLYAFTLQFIVSRFTENERWFFAFASLIYTGTFLFFIGECIKGIKWSNSFPQKVFFIFIIVIVPFYVGVTGVRFWTALFLFSTFLIRYLNTGDRKQIFYTIPIALVHFSFLFPILLGIIYMLLLKRKYWTFIVFVFSIIIFFVSSSSQALGFITRNLSFMNDYGFGGRVETYTDTQLLQVRGKDIAQTNWYVTLRGDLITIILMVIFILDYFGWLQIKHNNYIERLKPFLLLWASVTLITYNLGSLARFNYLFYLFIIYYLVYLSGINENIQKLRAIAFILLPVLLLHIFVIGRAGFYFVDPLIFTPTSIVTFFIQSDISLSELIVGH